MLRQYEFLNDRQPLYPLSVEAYHALGRLGLIDEDVELLAGFLFKTSSKSPLHETIIRRLARSLTGQLTAEYFLMKESPLTTRNCEPEPDLAVIRGQEEDFTERHPWSAELIIEVAINTLPRDQDKANLYAAAGVPEYWIIEPETATCTVFTKPTSTGYQSMLKQVAPAEISSSVLPKLRINLEQLFR